MKELESVSNPIIAKAYAAGGANTTNAGMDDINLGGGGSGSGGPTVEEVD